MRLPMKPSQTPDTTAILPMVLDKRMAVASTSFAVFAPRTTSSRRITLAGLKKCRPITSCGRRVNFAISSRFSAEVLEASTAPCRTTPSRVSKTWRFTSMFSNTASMTRSTSRNPAKSKAGLAQRPLVIAADVGEPAVERFLLRLEQYDRQPGVDEAHRDAAAHGPGADDAD